ncbi:MAG: hypothetical protein ACJ739_10565 [Acidimicrobiales bacterium]
MAAVVAILGLCVSVLAVLVVGLLRSHAEILRALHDLGVNLEEGTAPARAGSTAPMHTAPGVARPRGEDAPLGAAGDLSGTLPTGGAAHVAVAGVDHSTLLAFLSTGCGTCGTFWEELAHHDDTPLPGESTRVVIVTNGPDAESPAAVAELAPSGLVTVMSSEAWDLYDVPVSPYFVLVDGPSSRIVGEGAGTSWRQILDLLGRAMADQARTTPRSAARPSLARMRGQDRAERVDAELRAAGIEPGHESLYPAAHPSHEIEEAGR